MDNVFTHLDADGRARMVDVGNKPPTRRTAVVKAVVRLSEKTYSLLVDDALPKGDVLTTAKLAGIMAAKRTSDLIPLCHPLYLTQVDVRFALDPKEFLILVEAEAKTEGQTGVEMEAMCAASVAALTIYDMCKAVQKDIVIESIRLVSKTGGKSGEFKAE